jgi:hypothetical protein
MLYTEAKAAIPDFSKIENTVLINKIMFIKIFSNQNL